MRSLFISLALAFLFAGCNEHEPTGELPNNQVRALSILEKEAGFSANLESNILKVRKSLSVNLGLQENGTDYIVLPTRIEGLYSVNKRDTSYLVSADGEYVIYGNLVSTRLPREDLSLLDRMSVSHLISEQVPTDDSAAPPVDISVANRAGNKPQGDSIRKIPADIWESGSLAPSNYLKEPMMVSEPLIQRMADIAVHYPGLLKAEFIDALSIIRSYSANRIPLEHITSVHPRSNSQVNNGSITIFADPTCPNCQKLRGEYSLLQAAGFDIREVLFARNPKNKELVTAIERASCIPQGNDREKYVNQLFEGVAPAVPTGCQEGGSPHLDEALEFYGVDQTPTIMIDSIGAVINGYVSSEIIIELVDSKKEREGA